MSKKIKHVSTFMAVAMASVFSGLAMGQPMLHSSEHPLTLKTDTGSHFTVTGNASLTSDYRFRGFTQTNYGAAFQGGFDIQHHSGLYAGNWNSNVSSSLLNGANLEMDFYAGYKGKLANGIGYDTGFVYYYYPRSGKAGSPIAGQKVKNSELYVGASYGPFIAKYFYATSDYFSTAKLFGAPNSTKGSTYLDLNFRQDIGYGLTLGAHAGLLNVKNNEQFTQVDGSALPKRVADYKVSLTKRVEGFDLTGAVVTTSKKGYFANSLTAPFEEAGKTRGVVSVERLF